MELKCKEVKKWKEALRTYKTQINSLNKPNLVTLDEFYTTQLPSLIRSRHPTPYITRTELHTLMQWKLTRGKFRPRLLHLISALDEDLVVSCSKRAFIEVNNNNNLSKAVGELTVLKGVGPATASAVLAAFHPTLAPFMSDQAMEAVLGHSKDYSLKQYLLLATKLQEKAKELSSEEEQFTASDVERALWSSAVGAKLAAASGKEQQVASTKSAERKRKKPN